MFISSVELVTTWYFDRISDEINAKLQGVGCLSLGDLTTEYGLPVDTMKSIVDNRLCTRIDAQMKNSLLYTRVYVERQQARIFGVFSAVTKPTSLTLVAGSLGMDVADLEKQVQDLSVSLNGTVKAGEFVPNSFASLQRSACDGFFRNNGFLPFDMAKKLQLPKGLLKYVQVTYPDAVLLDSCVLSGAISQSFNSSVDECISNQTYIDTRTILPDQLSFADLSALASKSKSIGQSQKTAKALVLAHYFIVSKGLMNALVDLVSMQAGSDAQVDVNNKPAKITKPSGKSKKSSKTKRKGLDEEVGGHIHHDNSDDPYLLQQLEARAVPGNLFGLIEQQFPLLDTCGNAGDETLVEELAAEILPAYISAFKSTYNDLAFSVHYGDAAARRRKQTDLESTFSLLFNKLQLCIKGVSKLETLANRLEGDQSNITDGVIEYLVRVKAVQVIGLLIEHQCAQHALDFVVVGQDAAQAEAKLSASAVKRSGSFVETKGMEERVQMKNASEEWVSVEVCKAATQRMPESTIQERLDELLKLTQQEEPPSAIGCGLLAEKIGEVARDCSLIARAVDKKTERSLLQTLRSELIDSMSKTTSENQLLVYSFALILQQCHQVVLPLPASEDPQFVQSCKHLLPIVCMSLPPDRVVLLEKLARGGSDSETFKEVRELATAKKPGKK
mmetsp:Transcript_10324/g.22378  ORF Transcript_10324/g.22378 Transcript_10324/m.22378 type:complete len:673 (+) Transcript_10324:419-2437(+)